MQVGCTGSNTATSEAQTAKGDRVLGTLDQAGEPPLLGREAILEGCVGSPPQEWQLDATSTDEGPGGSHSVWRDARATFADSTR